MDVTATVSATTEDGAGNTYPNGHNTSQNDADISATEDSLDASTYYMFNGVSIGMLPKPTLQTFES